MPMHIIQGVSHTDHGLSQGVFDYIVDKFSDRDGFFKEVIDLPQHLHAPCGLYGPTMGDEPIDPNEIFLARRSDRSGLTPLIKRPHRNVSKLFVVAGPYQDPSAKLDLSCMLYTCYGGTESPMEPWDEKIIQDPDKVAESKAFWAPTGGHALAVPHGYAIVRIRNKNYAHVTARAIANGITIQVLDRPSDPHPATGDAMAWLYVSCSGNKFHELMESIKVTVY